MQGQPQEKVEKAITIFNKYWDIYKDSTPHLLLISTETDLRPEQELIIDKLPLDRKLDYYTRLYFTVTDRNSNLSIDPSKIIDIDVQKEIIAFTMEAEEPPKR